MKYVVYLFLFPTALLFSQYFKQEVTGTVLDKKTKEPVQGANILIVDSNNGASSDKDGNFILTLSPGKYVLKISLIGFNSITDTINITNNQHNALRYELDETEIHAIEEKVFVLTEKSALKDISQNKYRIFIAEYNDSIKSIIEKVAAKYGFTVYWPDDVYMIVTVDRYNDTMIKYLEKRNGKNWYQRFLKDMDAALKR